MKKSILIIFILALGFGIALGDLTSVYAQDEFTLEAVTVTAQKREENLQKAAIAVETISGYEITEMGRTTLEEALVGIATATVQKKGRELNVTIRAMDDDSMPGDSFAMVAVTVDGTYNNLFGTGYSGLYDMQRLEVLTGPQGTLYSRNSAGGVVNMISNNPTTESFEGSASIEFGTYHLMNTSGMVNVPLSETVALRGAFQTAFHDGYYSNGTNDNDTKSARFKVGYDHPSQDLSVILTFDYNSQRGHGQGDGVDIWETPPENPWGSTIPEDQTHTNRDTSKVYMNLEWSTPIGDLTLLPSLTHNELNDLVPTTERQPDGSTIFVTGGHRSIMHDYSTELRMNSLEDSSIKWVVGVFWYEYMWNTRGTRFDEQGYDITDPGYRIQTNVNKAAFGNLTYPVTDRFRLTVGGRHTSDDETQDSYDITPRPGRPEYEYNEYPSSHFDYKLGLEYDLGADMMLWADHSTGYKHIARNRLSQELASYQLGIKSRFLEQRLQVNATAWYYDYVNFNVNKRKTYYDEFGDEQTDRGTGIGDAVLYGLDLASNYLLTPNDRIDLSFSYLSSETSGLVINYEDYYSPDYALEGLPLNSAPEFTIVGSYQHIFHLSSGGRITSKLSTRYETEKTIAFLPNQSEYPGFNLNILNQEPSHHISEASLVYSDPNGRWSISGYIKNIENHPEKVGLMRDDLRVGEPRTFGAVMSLRFF
ncbi:TonB-dependent receptor [Deltaproteobacteria bacterium]|nr:TonB-dependent receptor [Deltaproteobacteria bacterium]